MIGIAGVGVKSDHGRVAGVAADLAHQGFDLPYDQPLVANAAGQMELALGFQPDQDFGLPDRKRALGDPWLDGRFQAQQAKQMGGDGSGIPSASADAGNAESLLHLVL